MEDKEKIIFYLNFAKTKLDKNNLSHKKANEEITELIKKLNK
jgi:hypothetical protein